MQSKVLATLLTLVMQMSRRVEERKRGLGCWMNQMTPHGSLTPVSAGLQTCSIRASLSKQTDSISRHMTYKGLC